LIVKIQTDRSLIETSLSESKRDLYIFAYNFGRYWLCYTFIAEFNREKNWKSFNIYQS